MYAEYSGLVFDEQGYMDSHSFNKILNEIIEFLDKMITREHQIYAIGISFLKHNVKKIQHAEQLKKILGSDWKALRFRNLVRLGADIENAGLGTLSRATLIGALLYYKEKFLCG